MFIMGTRVNTLYCGDVLNIPRKEQTHSKATHITRLSTMLKKKTLETDKWYSTDQW